MGKELDTTITTLGNFRNATKLLLDDLQLYVNIEDSGPLIEVTDVQLVLPKEKDDESYIILRAR